MISNPTPQRRLRGHRPARPGPHAANTAEHQARLAARLTDRDRWLAHMLAEHRVLTSSQITTLAFPSARAARQRLLELYRWSVIDRFQPFVTVGTAPMHYILGPAGATTLAAVHGLEPKELGYRHQRAMAMAHNLQLAHTVGVGDLATALIDHAHHDSDTSVTAWWSETRCTRLYGDLVRPDAYLRLTTRAGELEFFCEYDCGTETLARLSRKLHGYARLATASGLVTPILIWLPSTQREATARRALTQVHTGLDHPEAVPVATGAPLTSEVGPAEQVWLPLHTTHPRHTPAELARARPQLASPRQPLKEPASETPQPGPLPPPSPMPPTPAHPGRR